MPNQCLRAAATIVLACMLALVLVISDARLVFAQPSAPDPARAESADQAAPDVNLEYFRERLSQYGQWIDHPRWGEVWQPDAGPNFRPYFYGYWQYTTDFGSLWISDEPFGDIVYHYGRWVFDPAYGWLWVPGYVWGPSWVVWRANQDYVGWFPMPPGYLDYGQTFLTAPYAADRWYGYQTFYGTTFVSEYYFTFWVFVPKKDFGRHDRRDHVKDIRKLRDLYNGSIDCTRYVVDNDRIVDRFIDRDWIERETGRTVEAGPARRLLTGNTPIMRLSEGRNIVRRQAVERVRRAEPADGDRSGARTSVGGGAVPVRRGTNFPDRPRIGLPARTPQTPSADATVPDRAAAPLAGSPLPRRSAPYTDGAPGVTVHRYSGTATSPAAPSLSSIPSRAPSIVQGQTSAPSVGGNVPARRALVGREISGASPSGAATVTPPVTSTIPATSSSSSLRSSPSSTRGANSGSGSSGSATTFLGRGRGF